MFDIKSVPLVDPNWYNESLGNNKLCGENTELLTEYGVESLNQLKAHCKGNYHPGPLKA